MKFFALEFRIPLHNLPLKTEEESASSIPVNTTLNSTTDFRLSL
jgi:hypothetical protein